MFVSGFTIVRNAVKYDYPIVEAILSVLPLCDEFIVLVGNSEDDTKALIQSIDSDKIKIYDSIWDDSLKKGGRVLALETDKAKKLVSSKADWLFYIQADEVLHDKYLPIVKDTMGKWLGDSRVEGLLFNYTHFYGSYNYVGDSRKWYRKEIRVLKNLPEIASYRDAQGFRISDRKLNVKPIDAQIFHYGWVKPPELQQAKQKYFHTLWHDEKWMDKHVGKGEKFDYSQIDSLKLFKGTHPNVMLDRINKKNWHFDFDPTKKNFGLKASFLYYLEKNTGFRIGEYKNYNII